MHPSFQTPKGKWLALNLFLVLCMVLVAPAGIRAQANSLPPASDSPALPGTGQSHIFLPVVMKIAGQVAGASSFDLIDQAVAAGMISAETGLIYKVYDVFGDPRLPASYKGDDSQIDTSHILDEVAAKFNSLSSQGQSALLPFFIPPAYSNSATGQHAALTRASLGADPTPSPVCGSLSASWAFVDTVNAGVNARVWYQVANPGDAANAIAIRDALDSTIWNKLTGLMGRAPLSDGSVECNGLGDRYDFYLVGGITDKGLTSNYPSYQLISCKHNAAFSLINRTLSQGEMLGTVVHELMHGIQWAYNVASLCLNSEYTWLMEATATWAIDYVYPNTVVNDMEHAYAPWFWDKPAAPLELMDSHHEYGAYTFFLYLARKFSPSVISQIWSATESYKSLPAINASISGGFDARWPEYALYNWNQKPVDYYTQWDSLTSHPQKDKGYEELDTSLGGGPDHQWSLTADVPHLNAHYYDITFPDPSVHGFTFYNGWLFKLSQVTVNDPPGSYSTIAWQTASPDAVKGAKVQALLKINGTWQAPQDWSGDPYHTFCRDIPQQHLDELVLIVSNSVSQDTNYKLQPPGINPVVTATNIACGRWQGQASGETQGFSDGFIPFFSQASNVTMEAVLTPATGTTAGGATYLRGTNFVLRGGTVTTTVNVSVGGCTFSASATQPAPQYAILFLINNFSISGSTHRRYTGGGNALYNINDSCATSPVLQVTPWISLGDPANEWTAHAIQVVSADGQKMSNSAIGGQDIHYNWDFNAVSSSP